MGGYGSGRPATRQGAEETRRFPASYPAEGLRRLRALEPGQVGQASGVITWSSRGQATGSAGYSVAEGRAGQFWCILGYSLNGADVRDPIALVERPSNLPGCAGAVVYLRCPRCDGLARVLYLCEECGRFRCRRCVRPVYQSSRESDPRVSRILAGILDDLAPDAEALQIPLGRLGAAQMAEMGRRSFSGLLLALKVLDKLGQGIGRGRERPADYWHGAAGRPWSPARRAAQRTR